MADRRVDRCLQGIRCGNTVGGNTTTYTWDVNSSLPVVLQDGSRTYVYGLGLISQTDTSGNQSYFLGNGLGSTEALTDGDGDATCRDDAFGDGQAERPGVSRSRGAGDERPRPR